MKKLPFLKILKLALLGLETSVIVFTRVGIAIAFPSETKQLTTFHGGWLAGGREGNFQLSSLSKNDHNWGHYLLDLPDPNSFNSSSVRTCQLRLWFESSPLPPPFPLICACAVRLCAVCACVEVNCSRRGQDPVLAPS